MNVGGPRPSQKLIWRPVHDPNLFGAFYLQAAVFAPFLKPRHKAAARRMILAPEARQNHSPAVGWSAQRGSRLLGQRCAATLPRDPKQNHLRDVPSRGTAPGAQQSECIRPVACDLPRGGMRQTRHRPCLTRPARAVEATASRGAPAEDLRQPPGSVTSRRWREEDDLTLEATGACMKDVGSAQIWRSALPGRSQAMHLVAKPNARFGRRAGVLAEWRIFRHKSFSWQPLSAVPTHRSGRFSGRFQLAVQSPL